MTIRCGSQWLVAVALLAMPAGSAAQTDPQAPVTFTKDIAPILQRSCQNCHRPEGGAPMSLVTYEDVRPWARAIKQRTSLREMPPWFIEKSVGIQQFKDDLSLTSEEIATLAAWADSGARQGNPADMPPARKFLPADAWTLGTPDLIVSSPVVTVKAVAPDFFGPLESTPTRLTEDRYIQAVEIKEVRLPGQTGVRTAGRGTGDLTLFAVHHAEITTGNSRLFDGTAAAQGDFNHFNSGDFNVVYELGQNAMIYPDGLGVILRAGAVLNFPDVHLHSVGRDLPVRIDVAFKFHPRGYKPKYTQAAGLQVWLDRSSQDLDIPPGEDNIRFDGFYRLPQSLKVLTFEPHLHSSGKRMCAEAIYPNGEREWLNCAGYNHNWVKAYVYQDDVAPLLPKDTIIHMIGWYNNTPKNPRVVDPRNWKGWGNRSIEDMFHLLPKAIVLTDDEFKAEVAERAAKQSRTTSARTNP